MSLSTWKKLVTDIYFDCHQFLDRDKVNKNFNSLEIEKYTELLKTSMHFS